MRKKPNNSAGALIKKARETIKESERLIKKLGERSAAWRGDIIAEQLHRKRYWSKL